MSTTGTSARDWRQIGVAVAGMINFLNLYNVQALMPTLAAQFHVSLARTGLVITASLIAVALVAPFVGSISDMLGRKRLIVGAIWALTLPTLAAAGAGSLDQLIAARFVQGLLLPFIFTVTIAYIGDEATGAAGVRLIAAYSLGTIFGGFSGRFIAGFVAEGAGWRVSFLLFAALTAAAALVVQATLPRERNFSPLRGWRGAREGFAEHLRDRRMVATFGVGFGVLFSLVAAFTYSNFLLAGPPYALGPAALGSVFTVYLVGVVSTVASSRLILRYGRRATMVMMTAGGIAGLALTLIPNLVAVIAGLGLIAGAMFVQQTLATGFIGVAARRAKSIAVGLYVTCYYIGGSLGGVVPGGLWNAAGWTGCVLLIVAVQLAMTAAAWIFWRERPAA